MFFAEGEKLLGILGLADPLKPTSKEAVDSFHQMGIDVVMLTGDNEIVGGAVGKLLNMDHIYTNLLPAEKVEKVEEFIDSQQEDEKLVYVGDGINDAPVLKRADIGIAMGTLGAAAAVEAADIVLMEDDPSMILVILRIARETIGAIRHECRAVNRHEIDFTDLGGNGVDLYVDGDHRRCDHYAGYII